ncbi:MAG TPA: AraC family transcriptional regulator [Stellaceae bacterium]|jgi:AraC-like DNA-binding protein|nr:AraC family transcriptional regulator [Stellaceae bacterium]
MASGGSPRSDFLATDHPCPGIQRLRAGFFGHAYDPHRHETYAIGVTERGTQAFRYRGIDRASTIGMTMVLHPDELHDGHAVAPDGFVYRMLYIDAALIGAALGRGPLPFVADAVGPDPVLVATLDEAFEGFPGEFTSLAGAGIVGAIADRLARRAGRQAAPRPAHYYSSRLDRARERLDAATDLSATAEDLEAATGLDRYTLARVFRARFGTSPHRYLVGRRLQLAKEAIAAGETLAEAALTGGFADQSHMTRHFKARFGLTTGRYAQLLRRSDRSAGHA